MTNLTYVHFSWAVSYYFVIIAENSYVKTKSNCDLRVKALSCIYYTLTKSTLSLHNVI